MKEKSFRVNDFITLKLEKSRTHIYIAGEWFLTCQNLVLNIPIKEINHFNKIDSIDEISDIMKKSNDPSIEIPAEVEFWGHCSNLQTWVENNYDSRLLHSNLAFPLLKKLTEEGDLIAKRAFKEEIAKRLVQCYLPTINFLLQYDFIDQLSDSELDFIFSNKILRQKLVKSIHSENTSQILISIEILKKFSDLGSQFATRLLKKNLIRILRLNNFKLNFFILKENLISLLDKGSIINQVLNPDSYFLINYTRDLSRKIFEVDVEVSKEIDDSFLNFLKSIYLLSKDELKKIIMIILKEDWKDDLSCVNIPLYFISLIDSDFLDEILIEFINSYHNNLLPLITDTSFLSNLSAKGKKKILKDSSFIELCNQYKFLTTFFK